MKTGHFISWFLLKLLCKCLINHTDMTAFSISTKHTRNKSWVFYCLQNMQSCRPLLDDTTTTGRTVRSTPFWWTINTNKTWFHFPINLDRFIVHCAEISLNSIFVLLTQSHRNILFFKTFSQSLIYICSFKIHFIFTSLQLALFLLFLFRVQMTDK